MALRIIIALGLLSLVLSYFFGHYIAEIIKAMDDKHFFSDRDNVVIAVWIVVFSVFGFLLLDIVEVFTGYR